jgi:hypothetical protein
MPVRGVKECGRPTQSLRCQKKAMRSTEVSPYCDMTFTNVTACFPQVNHPKLCYYGALHKLQASVSGNKHATKNSIFWYITPSRPVKVNRCFGGTYRLYLRYRRVNQARNKRETEACTVLLAGYIPGAGCIPEPATFQLELLTNCQLKTNVSCKRKRSISWNLIPM